MRRTVKTLIGLAIFIAVFYWVENWRGNRAWEACKAELSAKGEVMEWKGYIPKPVPDEQNVMKAPIMQTWFIKSSNQPPRLRELTSFGRLTDVAGQKFTQNPLIILTPGSNESPGTSDVVLPISDLSGADLMGLITENLSQGIKTYQAPMGGTIMGAKYKTIPKNIYVKAEKIPDVKELENMINAQDRSIKKQGRFAVLPTPQNNVFQLQQKGDSGNGIYYAPDFIAWSDGFKPEFDAIREAVRRPYVRMDGTYITPLDLDIPNFVTLRTVSQLFASRAYAHLLLNQPEEAVNDLGFIKDLTRCLEGDHTLVSAMIRVAIYGLYGTVVQNGFLDNLWQEPQWLSIQNQFKDVDLLGSYANGMRGERAFVFLLDKMTAKDYQKIFQSSHSKEQFYLEVCPRGWLRQNQAFFVRMHQKHLDTVDFKQKIIHPILIDESFRFLGKQVERATPYNWFSCSAFPNFAKAAQTMARNQTLINQSMIVCALERYRKTKGSFPETLESLQPTYIEKVPHDIIGGQPLKYRRQDNNQFKLYSVAWDEKDNDGNDNGDIDWVWNARRQ